MAADYRHIGGVENRLGRHYSRFSPFWPAASFADQSLALRKSWNAGSNRRSQVNSGRTDRWRSSSMPKAMPPTASISATVLSVVMSAVGGRGRPRLSVDHLL